MQGDVRDVDGGSACGGRGCAAAAGQPCCPALEGGLPTMRALSLESQTLDMKVISRGKGRSWRWRTCDDRRSTLLERHQ